jgi:hypothetical protein
VAQSEALSSSSSTAKKKKKKKKKHLIINYSVENPEFQFNYSYSSHKTSSKPKYEKHPLLVPGGHVGR